MRAPYPFPSSVGIDWNVDSAHAIAFVAEAYQWSLFLLRLFLSYRLYFNCGAEKIIGLPPMFLECIECRWPVLLFLRVK